MIVDSHVHFGDSDHQAPIFRNELPPVFRDIAAPHGVTGVVHAETLGGQAENRWILELAAADPYILGMVASLDPRSKRFADELAECAADPLFRGLRIHELTADAVEDGQFLRNLQALLNVDRSLDLHVHHQDFKPVVALTRQLPELRIILNHICQGRPITGGEPNPDWAAAIHIMASAANVYCKVSGLVQQVADEPPAPCEPAFYTPVIDILWEAFGEERLIFASNWPQIEEVSDYASAFDIVDAYFTARGPAARDRFFWRNSAAAYQWTARSDPAAPDAG